MGLFDQSLSQRISTLLLPPLAQTHASQLLPTHHDQPPSSTHRCQLIKLFVHRGLAPRHRPLLHHLCGL